MLVILVDYWESFEGVCENADVRCLLVLVERWNYRVSLKNGKLCLIFCADFLYHQLVLCLVVLRSIHQLVCVWLC
ncbi:hypothetical protein Hanom_Chr07g00619871 [Helianthus anomalus]